MVGQRAVPCRPMVSYVGPSTARPTSGRAWAGYSGYRGLGPAHLASTRPLRHRLLPATQTRRRAKPSQAPPRRARYPSPPRRRPIAAARALDPLLLAPPAAAAATQVRGTQDSLSVLARARIFPCWVLNLSFSSCFVFLGQMMPRQCGNRALLAEGSSTVVVVHGRKTRGGISTVTSSRRRSHGGVRYHRCCPPRAYLWRKGDHLPLHHAKISARCSEVIDRVLIFL